MATSGAVEYRTSKVGLAAIRFDFPNWADEVNGNWRLIDSLLGTFTGNIKGLWSIATIYAVGDRVVSETTGAIYEALIAHTSPTTGTIEQDIAANPNKWRLTSSNATFRGNWVAGTIYSNNSFVIVNNAYYISTQDHTASSTFAADLMTGKWVVLVDLNPFIGNISLAASNAQAAIDAAVTGAQSTISSAVSAAQGSISTAVANGISTVNASVGQVTGARDDAIAAANLAMQYRDQAAAAIGFNINDYTLLSSFNPLQTAYNTHAANTSNPHSVTKTQVGLGSVDNTADSAKPVSTAQAASIATKVSKSGDTLTGALFLTKIDKGTIGTGTVTFDLTASNRQRLQVSGALTIALSNKPAVDWQLDIELVNGGAAAITWPTVSWYKGDGTVGTAFADTGKALQTSGTNTVILFGTGNGTVFGMAI